MNWSYSSEGEASTGNLPSPQLLRAPGCAPSNGARRSVPSRPHAQKGFPGFVNWGWEGR